MIRAREFFGCAVAGSSGGAVGRHRLGCRIAALVAILLALFQAPGTMRAAVPERVSAPKVAPRSAAGSHAAVRMRVLVTAYCLRGRTFTGSLVSYGTVAVDPQVIPLHSRLFIPNYGYGYALDTGGAVKGRHVDEWRPSCRDALRATRYETITVWPHR